MKYFLITILLFIFSFSNAIDFSHLRPKDGLMDSEINSIVQDNDGVLWLATWWGLISYNGFDFNEYRPEIGNPYSLPDKKIQFLFVDSDNILWILTSNSLSRYDKKFNRFYNYEFDFEPNTQIFFHSISEFRKNIIIRAVNDVFLFPHDKKHYEDYTLKSIQLEYPDHINDYHYINYTISQGDKLFLISNNFTHNRSKIFEAKNLILTNNDTILELGALFEVKNRIFNSLSYSRNEQKIYTATNNGIIGYSLKSNKIDKTINLPGKDIQEIVCTSNNEIFCSTGEPEIFEIDLHTGKTNYHIANPYLEGSLLNSRILAMFEDFSGNLWIGHQGQGISILNLHKKAFISYKQDPFSKFPLQSNQIMSIYATDKEIFIGGRTGGLSILPRESKNARQSEFKILQETVNGKLIPFEYGIWDIQKQNQDLFWVGTDIGLYKLQRKNNNWHLERYINDNTFNNPVRKIFIDKNNNIWCGVFNQGLIFIPDTKTNQSKQYYLFNTSKNDSTTITDNVVLTFKLDSKDRFWIGTTNGLNLLNGKYSSLDLSGKSNPQVTFKRYLSVSKKDHQLNNNEINCIYENNDGKLWLGTQGGGINILNPETDSFQYITQSTGLPCNDIQGILSDEAGILWVSTSKGLISYNQLNTESKIKYYHQSDGIQGDIFLVNSYFKTLDGEMYFGGDEGFTRFYPQEVKPNTIEPKVSLTNLSFNNKIVQIGDTIYGKEILNTHIDYTKKLVFNHKHKVFSIGVAVIHYQNPDGNIIKYKLDGYDKEWRTIPAKYRNVYYSNLPTGIYTLNIKAINSDNVISSNVKQIEIEVKPPWYFTWYMVTIFIIVALSVLFSLGFIIVNRQRLVYETKIDKLKLDNAESKMRFLTNIAHGLKTPLSLVIAPTEDLVNNYTDIKKEWKEHLILIHRNSNYLLKLINQIIDFRKLNSGKLKLNLMNADIIELLREVIYNFKSFETHKQIQIKLDVPFDSLILNIDRQKIEEVLYNLLSNAFKHTDTNKKIILSLQVIENEDNTNKNIVKITVFNEGETISEEEQTKIFERFYKIDDKKDGAGIGLSFSKSLIELHSGDIEVESLQGKGMAFHVLLPYNTMSDVTENIILPNTNKNNIQNTESFITENNIDESIHQKDDKLLKVVLVEDNDELRNFLKNILSRRYNCYDAPNGHDGYSLIKEIIPDIVISDIIMPEMDGYELCKKIKANSKTCHIPIILLSAKSSHEQIVKGYQLGADTYVTKPFDIEIISSQISRLIKNRELIKKKYQEQNFMVEVSTSNLSKDDEFILNIRELLENNLSDANYNVKQIADDLEVSTTQLYRKLKAITGYSPVEFLRIIRLQYAYKLINDRKKSVKEVCYLSGFNNISYFIKCFKDQFGITPASMRDNGNALHENFDDTKHTRIQKL